MGTEGYDLGDPGDEGHRLGMTAEKGQVASQVRRLWASARLAGSKTEIFAAEGVQHPDNAGSDHYFHAAQDKLSEGIQR